jgi:crotonobetainyl-CoA:carnitine CoA-transferase CaiB-like acyl-CoA transferase
VATSGDDDWIAIAPRTLDEIDALCALTGEAALALQIVRRMDTSTTDDTRKALERAAARWAAMRSREEALDLLRRAGIPAVPIATVADLLADPRLQAGGAWIETMHPETGATRSYGPAIGLRGIDADARPAPLLGADNDYVFGTLLGLSRERIDDLTERHVL